MTQTSGHQVTYAAPAPVPTVKPEPDSTLEQLVATFEHVKAQADEYEKRLKAIKDQIKVELVRAAPGHNTIRLESDHLKTPYRLVAKTQRRLDSRALKAVEPDVWEKYARDATAWYFEAAG